MRAVEAQFQGNGTAVSLMFLAELCARGDAAGDHKKIELLFALLRMYGAQEHSARIDAHHRSGRQVGYGYERLADKLFGLIIGMNTA